MCKLLRRDIKINNDPFDLICKTINVKTIHDYKILTDLNYRFKHMKININLCLNCKSNKIIFDDQKTCIDCGSVLDNVYVTSYNQRDNYTISKRNTYVKIITNQKIR